MAAEWSRSETNAPICANNISITCNYHPLPYPAVHRTMHAAYVSDVVVKLADNYTLLTMLAISSFLRLNGVIENQLWTRPPCAQGQGDATLNRNRIFVTLHVHDSFVVGRYSRAAHRDLEGATNVAGRSLLLSPCETPKLFTYVVDSLSCLSHQSSGYGTYVDDLKRDAGAPKRHPDKAPRRCF
ncbi:hypothetical protein BJ546DRAFT_948610 [Cryomyces antarcticus]